MSGTKLYLSRDGHTKTRFMDKCKLLKVRIPNVKLVLINLKSVVEDVDQDN